jgi:hypothetical protein
MYDEAEIIVRIKRYEHLPFHHIGSANYSVGTYYSQNEVKMNWT